MKRKAVSGIGLTLLLIGMLTLAFNIQSVKASGTIYIKADGSVDPPDAPIYTGDNVTYTLTDNISDEIVVERDHITIDGAGYTLQGAGAYLSEGIKLWGRSNITIKNVEVINFYYGIFLVYSSNNTLTGNTALNNKDGIRLYRSGNNNLAGNIASNNEWSGIFLDISSDNVLTDNTVSNNDDGINLWDSSNNIFAGNIASSNNRYGIWVRTPNTPSNNVLTGNTAFNNTFGVYLGYSSNNVIFHNNIINNTFQAGSTNGYANTWDDGYPSGGNYWSDYADVDLYSGSNQDILGSDGIWDNPYVINVDNQDNYPLTEPWSPLPRTIGELKTEIEELGSEGEIDNQGIVKSLIAKLNVAQRLVDKGKVDEAKTILSDDFILQVQNLSGVHITVEAADILTKSAEYILSHL